MEWFTGGPGKSLVMVRPDGTDSHVLADDVEPASEHVHADWSPDGQQVVFESLSPAETASIWTVGADGSDPALFAECATPQCAQLAYPSWSPNGEQIAYVRFDRLKNGDWGASYVEVAEVATGTRRVVASTGESYWGFQTAPRWSPNGEQLVVGVDLYDKGSPAQVIGERLAVLDVGGPADQSLRFITPRSAWASDPDWSPDGALIVYNDYNLSAFQELSKGSNIWTVRPDGRDPQQLTNSTDTDNLKYAEAS